MPRRRIARLDLAGERARLRPHRPGDAERAYALLGGRDEILRWLVWDGPGSVEELAEYYRNWCVEAEGGACDLRLAVEERASGELAGSITLRFAGHPQHGDVGYWIGLSFQRRGLGREALALAAHLAFQHLDAQSLYAWVFVGNLASRKVLERTGFTLARTVPGRIVKGGRRVDEWHFVLLRGEWRRLAGGVRPQVEEISWEDAAGAAADDPGRPRPGS
jgi:RimJ/RimL family protein N-acetyltransferase